MKALYKKLPPQYTHRIDREADYARIESYEAQVANAIISFTLLGAVAGYFFLDFTLIADILLGLVSGIITGLGLPWVYLSLRAERRKSKLEQNLPDALRLVSSNIRSGHTIEKAFLLSARDEFGPLAEELRTTAMEMYGGRAVEDSLQDLESRIKSELFQETLKLLIDGIKAGGDKADLLESSARDIRKSMELREEIKSSVRMYMIFIGMVAVVGAPVLFSVSVYMADVTTEMWDDADMDEVEAGGIGAEIGFDIEFSEPDVDVDFFETFAYMAIALTNLFAALIISEINNGNIKSGVKYAPVFVIISISIFAGVNLGLEYALDDVAGA